MTLPPAPTVAFLLASCESGGTEWFALRLAEGLAAEGFRPLFLVVKNKGALKDRMEKGAETIFLKGGDYTPLGIIRALPALVHFLRARRPTAVIGGLPLLNMLLAVASFLTKGSTRFIMVEPMRLNAVGLKQKIKTLLLRAAYARADEIVAVSQTVAQDLIRNAHLPENRIRVLPNPVIPANFEALAAEPPTHPWLQNKTIPTLLAVGRLLPVKDYPTLLRALAKLRETQETRLLIYGEGEERPALETLVSTLGLSESVALPGATDNVFSAMKHAALLVLSSSSESFGYVIVEALACGLPVVSSACGGPCEILANGAYGSLVSSGDPAALAQKIKEALATTPDRSALRARGLSFSVSASARAYQALLARLP